MLLFQSTLKKNPISSESQRLTILTLKLALELGSVGAEVLGVPEARPDEVGHVDLEFVHSQHVV